MGTSRCDRVLHTTSEPDVNTDLPAIQPFDPATASDADFDALHAFTSAVRERLTPGEPQTSLGEAIAAWRAIRVTGDVGVWLARDGSGAVIGRGQVASPKDGVNRHLAQASLDVLEGHRRRGIASALLARMCAHLAEGGRMSLVATTLGAAPAGEALMRALGAERGLETTVNQLELSGLDRARLAAWAAPDGAAAFSLEFRDGAHAEADLEALATLQEVMSGAPMGTLAVAHERRTPEQFRRIEAAMAARGLERWTLIARDAASGRFAGFTELYLPVHAPETLHQGDTGVFPEHRGHGLGRRLKAAMLERVLRERPAARVVRTSNADSNAAMLAINHELGFTPWLVRTVWQVEREAVERWLHSTPS
jgi:RimJ/RimL family protein N-acetyltransferase